MDKLIIGLLGALIVGSFVFLAAVMSTCFGALGGWAVGWLFDETSVKFLTIVGLDVEMWELGAALGFFGSFFRSHNINNNNS